LCDQSQFHGAEGSELPALLVWPRMNPFPSLMT
jgi:hypothetical protein